MSEPTTTESFAKRARRARVALTDRMCEKRVEERIKIYDRKCPGLYVSITTAGQRLRELLDSGPVTFEAVGTDRFRRTLAHVYAGDVDVGEALLKEGLALRYVPLRFR